MTRYAKPPVHPLQIPDDCWQTLEECQRQEDFGASFSSTVRCIGNERTRLSLSLIAKSLDEAAVVGEHAVRYTIQHLRSESLVVIAHTASSNSLKEVVHTGGRFPAALQRQGIPRWMHRKMQSEFFRDVPMSDQISLQLLGQVPLELFPNTSKEAGELVVLLHVLQEKVELGYARKAIEFSLSDGWAGALARLFALLRQAEAFCSTACAVGSHLSLGGAIDLALEEIAYVKSSWAVRSVLDTSISATVAPVFHLFGHSISHLVDGILGAHPALPTKHSEGLDVRPLNTVANILEASAEFDNCLQRLEKVLQYTGDGIAVYCLWRRDGPSCMFALTLTGDESVIVVEKFGFENRPASPMATALVHRFVDSFNDYKPDVARFRGFTALASAVRKKLGVVQH